MQTKYFGIRAPVLSVYARSSIIESRLEKLDPQVGRRKGRSKISGEESSTNNLSEQVNEMLKTMLNIMTMLKDVLSNKKNEEIPTVSTNEHSTADFMIASELVGPFKMDVHIEIPLYRGELDPD